MTTLIDHNPARVTAQSTTQYFYFYMALSCMAVAFLGFAPTYWLPMAARIVSADAGDPFSRPAVLRLDAVFHVPELARRIRHRSRGTARSA